MIFNRVAFEPRAKITELYIFWKERDVTRMIERVSDALWYVVFVGAEQFFFHSIGVDGDDVDLNGGWAKVILHSWAQPEYGLTRVPSIPFDTICFCGFLVFTNSIIDLFWL